MRYPSVKTLNAAFPGKGLAIRKVLDGRVSPYDYPKTAKWIDSCYNLPKIGERKMAACDEIIGGYGVEAIGLPEGSFENCQEPDVLIEYVNLGETYATTLLRIVRDGRIAYRVGSWGDVVERYDNA